MWVWVTSGGGGGIWGVLLVDGRISRITLSRVLGGVGPGVEIHWERRMYLTEKE